MSVSAPIPRSALRALRGDALAWWYHKQLRSQGNVREARKRERDSFRNAVGHIRAAQANGGFLSIGRGGTTLYYERNARCEGLHPGDLFACRTVLPTIDTRTVPPDKIVELTMKGPMPALASEPVERFCPMSDETAARTMFGISVPWRSLDRVPWPLLVPLYRAAGATLSNCEVQS